MHIICEGLSVERCIIGGKKSAVGGANRKFLAVLDLSNVQKYWAGPPNWSIFICIRIGLEMLDVMLLPPYL